MEDHELIEQRAKTLVRKPPEPKTKWYINFHGSWIEEDGCAAADALLLGFQVCLGRLSKITLKFPIGSKTQKGIIEKYEWYHSRKYGQDVWIQVDGKLYEEGELCLLK